METIFALATAPGKAGVSVVRISGPHAFSIGETLAGSLPEPRQTAVRIIKDRDGAPIDQALIVAFAHGHSFTGEDVVELQLHGSPAIQKAVLAELSTHLGARLAEPGEFTRRALENGRLDLSQVEALSDLIEAETEAQRKQAMRIMSGEMGEKVSLWRADLIHAAALLEATIDFADEEVPVDVTADVRALIEKTKALLRSQIEGSHVAERIRDGYRVAIVGAPNVGKSTLLNRLAGREAAITSEIAGTTRDVIEVSMDISGLPVTLLDTAGIRETDDVVEGLGIERALQRARDADLRVFLLEGGEDPQIAPGEGDIILQAKADVTGSGISGKTGQGVDDLIAQLSEVLGNRSLSAGTAINARHRQAMEAALVSLDDVLVQLDLGPDVYDLAAEGLRHAIRNLSSLIGLVDAEHILDDVFSNFCLGK
ncbi:tRNA uridine-5-carboxymethylaminomethyl(34) synthesis GTPase MnmE [Cognatishimia sp. MH4019]|uniref:tRNA uridine-5-carboxymethylaminomethyl(34) synthesis GTPase MnmE n=1 Tax=Cognatishimia sp. MH4019 TaxID=2854030 RepID=UPI001CD587A4|nr:tRNA uridine-5-carboxymethylaminomethyl(34) synthesis GTPase MnmE [Cognatishimia sp. MH4019]